MSLIRNARRLLPALLISLLSLQSLAQEQIVHVLGAKKHDKSKPLSKMVRKRPTPAVEGTVVEHRVRLLPLPHVKSPATKPSPEIVPQPSAGPLDAVVLSSFQGVGRGLGYITRSSPPDTNGSVGLGEYVQWVNQAYGIFDKTSGKLKPIQDLGTGHLETEILDGNQIWQGFGGKCEFSNDGDPIVIYDKIANRWVMSQFAYSKPPSPPYAQCIAVSSSADPAGEYSRYEYDFNNFNDYPKFGVWPDGYYAVFNMFEDESGDFLGTKVCAYERRKMLDGKDANMQCANLYNPQYSGILPADFDGTQSSLPPSNSPEYFLGIDANKLDLWKYTVDWDDLTKSEFDRTPVKIPVASFEFPCIQGNKAVSCIPQPNASTQQLDVLGDRLMYRLAYRNFGDHESLVVNHTVQVGGRTGVRWYELGGLAGTPTIVQQGTFAPEDGLFRWMGSIAMDKKGDMLLEYSVSGDSVFPSIRYTGRKRGDAPGAMRDEKTLMAGQGSQFSTKPNYATDRWGDYSSVSVDPGDDCTFWVTGQYLPSTDTYRWSTVISSVKFPDCQ